VRALPGGEVEVYSEPPPRQAPAPPLRAYLADVLADARHDTELHRLVRGIRPGESVTVPGLGYPRCITEFHPAQAWWLRELSIVGGAFGMVSAGGGKSVLFLESPLAVKCKTAGLFIKPDQRLHYRSLYLRLREHFRVPSVVFDDAGHGPGSYIVEGMPVLRIVPYSILSSIKSTALLDSYDFDAIFADEWHLLSNTTSSRTHRFLRAMAKPRPVPRIFAVHRDRR
jgi:hypothetical protein